MLNMNANNFHTTLKALLEHGAARGGVGRGSITWTPYVKHHKQCKNYKNATQKLYFDPNSTKSNVG